MNAQLAFLADPIDEAFLTFHHTNPAVAERLHELAHEWLALGHQHVGIATLYEVLRWERGRAGITDDAGWKLNNDYRSRYARHLMNTDPALAGMFVTRTIRADREQFDA